METVDKNKLIVALDVETAAEARRLVHTLKGIAGMFKIGSQLFTAAGPDFVREVVSSGERVFLDLKFHDIPNTVAAAGVEATRIGVSIFNIHAAGGSEMMRRTVDAVSECAASENIERPLVIAVTVLTSTDAATLTEVGYDSPPDSLVERLALLAEASKVDGVVASPREVRLIRSAVKNQQFVVITPGVRPEAAVLADQKRVATPREAIDAGADYIVVGRPILEAADPAGAAQEIIDEIGGRAAGNVAS